MRLYQPPYQDIHGPVIASADEELERSTAQANASAGGFMGWLGRLRQNLWNTPFGQRAMQGMEARGLRMPVGTSAAGLPIYPQVASTAPVGVGRVLNTAPATTTQPVAKEQAKQRIVPQTGTSPVADLMRYGRAVTMRPGTWGQPQWNSIRKMLA